MSGAVASLTLLTEDRGEGAFDTLRALVRGMLRLVDENTRSHRLRILPSDPVEEQAMRGSDWKSTDPALHERQVRLLRFIARRLSQPASFVLFHIDGDRPWNAREASENVAKFHKLVVDRLPRVVAVGRTQTRRIRGAPVVDEVPSLALHRLLLICPFYSIEAWLYQNTGTAVKICRREHQERCHERLYKKLTTGEQPEEWERPKDKVCLRSQYNQELAECNFPALDVYNQRSSFAQTVDRLKSCADLREALALTYFST